MLNKEARKRAEAFLKASDTELEKDTKYDPKFYVNAVKWLAETLIEMDNRCHEDIVISHNPLHVRDMIVATWNDGFYQCNFCSAKCRPFNIALDHYMRSHNP